MAKHLSPQQQRLVIEFIENHLCKNKDFMKIVYQMAKLYGLNNLHEPPAKTNFHQISIYIWNPDKGGKGWLNTLPCNLPVMRALDWVLAQVSYRNDYCELEHAAEIMCTMKEEDLASILENHSYGTLDPFKDYNRQIQFYLEAGEGFPHPSEGTFVNWNEAKGYIQTKARQHKGGGYTKLYLHPVGRGILGFHLEGIHTQRRMDVNYNTNHTKALYDHLNYSASRYRTIAIAFRHF